MTVYKLKSVYDGRMIKVAADSLEQAVHLAGWEGIAYTIEEQAPFDAFVMERIEPEQYYCGAV